MKPDRSISGKRSIVENKPFLTSWTLWFNVLTILSVALASAVTQEILSPQAMKWTIVVQAVINGLLRLKTNSPLSL